MRVGLAAGVCANAAEAMTSVASPTPNLIFNDIQVSFKGTTESDEPAQDPPNQL
jgi:hypothetical protein